jgi:hypothetical protein
VPVVTSCYISVSDLPEPFAMILLPGVLLYTCNKSFGLQEEKIKCFVAGLDTNFGMEIELCITVSSPYGVFKAMCCISGHNYSKLEPRIV